MSRHRPHDRRRLLRALGALAVSVLAAACGFTPLHAPGGAAAAARGRVVVDPLPGRTGLALRERLVERLGAPQAPTHRLAVAPEIRHEAIAPGRDGATQRVGVSARAGFALLPLGAGAPVLEGEVRARTDYSLPPLAAAPALAARSAARDAELRVAQTLADRIADRLVLAAEAWAAGPTALPW